MKVFKFYISNTMSLKVPSVGKRGGRKRFYSCVCCGAVQIDA